MYSKSFLYIILQVSVHDILNLFLLKSNIFSKYNIKNAILKYEYMLICIIPIIFLFLLFKRKVTVLLIKLKI